ncbi:MAG TPA: hypothetical protein VH092_31150 [Urbifossiella sp.]|jgi:hypothetical protein|nr:hypothetical protein [Urbifossiella sp.]
MIRSLHVVALGAALSVGAAVPPDRTAAPEKAKPKVAVATVELPEGLKAQVTGHALTGLLIKHAKGSGAFGEVELAADQVQRLAREARGDLLAGRVPPNLRAGPAAPPAPELLLVADVARDGEVTVMTAMLVDRTNLKIAATAEVRGSGKAGCLLDFPADVTHQLAGKPSHATLYVMLQTLDDVPNGESGPAVVSTLEEVQVFRGRWNKRLRYVSHAVGYAVSSDPKPDALTVSEWGWKLEWKGLAERREATLAVNRGIRWEYGFDDEFGAGASGGSGPLKANHPIVVSPWQAHRVVRVDADDLKLLGIDTGTAPLKVFQKQR